MKKGYDILKDSKVNKSTSFTVSERDEYGLHGLLPHKQGSLEDQKKRVFENLNRKAFDIERYIYLSALKERNERLYYSSVMSDLQRIMPLIYTPTVGQACKEFAQIFRFPRGMYIHREFKGKIKEVLGNWPEKDVRTIVVTDGERILGLGDLGSNGMGIPIGKLDLYVACAGIDPKHCMPVMLDVGTNNQELLDDPLYLGYPEKRLEGDEYFEFVNEFVVAVQEKYPDALIQFEDFTTINAYKLLDKYKDKVLCFNDDIQGTAGVVLAGVFASCRITKKEYKDLKIMFLGAGSAATGIADLMLSAFMDEGLSEKEAKKKLWLIDSKGLVVKSRKTIADNKIPYAQDQNEMNLIQAIKEYKPDILIGATASPNTFTKEVIELMTEINERPVIFALSNPTSKAECTAEQAYTWSKGKAVFASGSPFSEVHYEGHVFKPGQGNNAYIFPGVGLGALLTKSKSISEKMFLVAAKALAFHVTELDLQSGSLYPPLNSIREVSIEIARIVGEEAVSTGLAQCELPADVESIVYNPEY